MNLKVEYVVYNDGLEVARYANKRDAIDFVRLYDGDHEVWFEEEWFEE